MEWPDSVHIDTLSTHKAARKLRSRNPEGIDKRYTAGQREEYRRARRDAHPFIPSGVVLHAGERGAAVLRSIREDVVVSGKRRNGKHQAPRQRWDWEFANLTRPERPLRFSEEAAVFFPATIHRSEKTTAVHVVQQSSRSPSSTSSKQRNGKRKAAEGSTSNNDTGTGSDEDPAQKDDASAAAVQPSTAREQSQEDEDEDERPVPAEQQEPSTLTPGDADTAIRPEDSPAEETASEPSVRLADNRNPLATIRYVAKVKAADKMGFESFEILYVVFPMGAQGNQLNISLFKTFPQTRNKASKMPHFVPTVEPSFVCKDRILQVSVSNKRRAKYPFICIAVRTETLLYYLLVTPLSPTPFPIHQRAGSPVVRVELLSLVDSAGLENARAVDIAMHPEHFQQCLITTDAGVLYKWSIVRRTSSSLEGWVHEGKLVRVIRVPEEDKFAAASDFYRAVWGPRNDNVLLMNATHVWFLDLEGPELVVNTIDTSHTTTLFTSIDPSGAERDAEYLCLSTTDAIMWVDARDGQLVLSWEHMRHGETLEVRAVAGQAETTGETIYLVRSLENQKATLLHVRESIEGIQSRRDPYDILLPGEKSLVGKEPASSPAQEIIGFASMCIQDAPMPLSLLLFLEDNGQLSCGLQQPTNDPQAAAEPPGTSTGGKANSSVALALTPGQLILQRHQVEMNDQPDEDMIDDDLLQDMFPPEKEVSEQDEDGATETSYKQIQTRELWKNLCNAHSSAEAVFELASLRAFLNDHEQLPETGIFTLHELLAMSCENSMGEERFAQSDSVKSYTLLLSQDRVEKQIQLQDLLERLNMVLDRSELRISQLRDTIFRITGEISLASESSTGLEALEEGYLGGIDVYSTDEPLGKVHQRQQDAAFRLLCDLHLSATTLAPAAKDSGQQADRDTNISETLSRLSFSPPSKTTVPRTAFLKPSSSAECSEITAATIQALSSQWEIGSDPIDYVWPGKSNHRALDAEEDLPETFPQRPVRNPPSNVPAFRLPRQSALFNSSPALNPPFAPNFGTGESLPMLGTPSQVHFEGDSQRQPQDFASSQVMQGPFGGRNGASFRRSLGGKKRTIGF